MERTISLGVGAVLLTLYGSLEVTAVSPSPFPSFAQALSSCTYR